MFPVDLPAVSITDLTSAADLYLSSLESAPPQAECYQSSQGSQVAITAHSVRRLQLFEDGQPDGTLLVLHPPDEPTQVEALHLHGKWWRLDDVLRTSSTSRRGLMPVQSTVERVIVFLLSQVVERCSQEEVLFSLHPRTESCKLLWRDSRALGFYTVKHKGSLCDSWSSGCYLLPVLDTVLVRRSSRRRGFGLHMLQDFCSSFPTEPFVGVSAPMSASMVAVCRRFLQQHQEHRERLYEVEAPGGWSQRRNIWLSIQLGRYSLSAGRVGCADEQSSAGGGSANEFYTHGLDMSSPRTCNVNIPLAIDSPEKQRKPCDTSQGGSSPSSEISGTGCSPVAHNGHLDSGPPTRPPQSLHAKQAPVCKTVSSAEPRREEPEAEEGQGSTKRARRT